MQECFDLNENRCKVIAANECRGNYGSCEIKTKYISLGNCVNSCQGDLLTNEITKECYLNPKGCLNASSSSVCEVCSSEFTLINGICYSNYI